MSGAASGGSALVVVETVDSEVFGAHRKERLHKLHLGFLGQLSDLLYQVFNFLVGGHVKILAKNYNRATTSKGITQRTSYHE